LAETASAEASPCLSWRVRPFLDGLGRIMPLLILNARTSLFVQMACLSPVYVKVRQHDAYSSVQGAKSKNLSAKLPLILAKRRGRKRWGNRRLLLLGTKIICDSVSQRGDRRARDGTLGAPLARGPRTSHFRWCMMLLDPDRIRFCYLLK
jgi:hypothetical protein